MAARPGATIEDAVQIYRDAQEGYLLSGGQTMYSVSGRSERSGTSP